MEDQNFVGRLIDSCKASADRSRLIIVLIVVGGVLGGMSLFNSITSSSWSKARIDVASKALERFSKRMSPGPMVLPLEDCVPGPDYDDCLRINQWVNQKGIRSIDELKCHLCRLRESEIDNVQTVKVPLVDIRFDINDLGLLYGLTYFFLLLWLKFSLLRELENLTIIRRYGCNNWSGHGSDTNLAHKLYDILASGQVMTLPRLRCLSRDRDVQSVSSVILRKLAKLVVIIPVLVSGGIALMDSTTLSSGDVLDSSRAVVGLVIDWMLAVFILFFSCSCLLSTMAIDEEWHAWWKKVREPDDCCGGNPEGGSARSGGGRAAGY